MNGYRWNPYVLLSGVELHNCFITHFTSKSKILLIMGKGFDVRMNMALQELTLSPNKPKITCLLIDFDEGVESSSHQYGHLVEANMIELHSLIDSVNISNNHIELWQKNGRSKRRVGDRKAAAIIDKIDLNEYTDIIVDISALPRGIYFSMLGKLVTLIDIMEAPKKPNLMITVAENPTLDMAIQDDTPDEELYFLHGFSGEIDSSSIDLGEPTIWMPILGENKLLHMKKAYNFLRPSEMCPIFPFPSRDPRRPDSLIASYHAFLFDEIGVEQQNIMYVPEQNPFEAYKILSKAILNYTQSLKMIGECKTVLSTFSSKLLSIGTLLAAHELKGKGNSVGVLNVDSLGYRIDENIDLKKMREESNLNLIWVTGEPYYEN